LRGSCIQSESRLALALLAAALLTGLLPALLLLAALLRVALLLTALLAALLLLTRLLVRILVLLIHLRSSPTLFLSDREGFAPEQTDNAGAERSFRCVTFGKSELTRNRTRHAGISFKPIRKGGNAMGRYLLLWLLGVPLPILVLIWAFGGLH
jgi:hypothetical protein